MRPSIPHLSSEDLGWEEILNTGAQRKQFSVDPATGSDTSFVRLPPGWKGPAGAHYHSSFEEALVLSGDVDLNGNDLLVSGSYLYRPGGIVHGWVDHSPSGSDIIIKMGTDTDLISVGEPEHPYEYDYQEKRVPDGRPHIIHLKTAEHPWQKGGMDGVQRKTLSRDEDTGAETSLIRFEPGFKEGMELAIDQTWEWVVIDGAMTLADGTLFVRLDYSHRPAGGGETIIQSAPQGCTLLVWNDP